MAVHRLGGDLDRTLVAKLVNTPDLASLTGEERFDHYLAVCASLRLDPRMIPFKYFSFEPGTLSLYCLKGGTEQIRHVHRISITHLDARFDPVTPALWRVTAEARMPDGVTDRDEGHIWVDGLRGERLQNATMHAITKGKRRVTLSIVGAGMPDESELHSMRVTQTFTPNVETGDLVADIISGVPDPTRTAQLITGKQREKFYRLADAMHWTESEWRELLRRFGFPALEEVTRAKAFTMICEQLANPVAHAEIAAAIAGPSVDPNEADAEQREAA